MKTSGLVRIPRRFVTAALFAGAIAGCSSGPTVPERVEIPVPVPCLAVAPERPALRSDDELKGLDDYRVVAALLAERRKLQGYVQTLEAVAEGCR